MFDRNAHPALLAIRRLQTFLAFFYRTAYSTIIYQEHTYRELLLAFDGILQQFSSVGNKKPMPSAYRNLKEQKSICLTCSYMKLVFLIIEYC